MKPKRRIWLHIGMHKTGSSSIQSSFAGFDNGNLRFASLGVPNHSTAMALVFGSFFDDPKQSVKRGWNEPHRVKLRAWMKLLLDHELAIQEPAMLISGEEMCSLTLDQVRALRSRLLDAADEVRVLAYIRSPVGFMTSAFQQRVRGGLHRFRPAPPSYRHRFESFLQVFGPANVAFRAYEDATAGGRSVIADFAQWLGLDAGSVVEVRTNEGLSVAAVAVLAAGNKRTSTWLRTRALLDARRDVVDAVRLALPTAEYGKFHFDETVTHAALEPADIAWMERASGLSLMPPPPTGRKDPCAIGSLGDLLQMADRVQPEVAQMAVAAGIPVSSDVTSGEVVELLLRRRLAMAGAEIQFKPLEKSN